MASTRDSCGLNINIPDSSNSGEDYSTKGKFPVLTRHKWYKWRAKFKNLLISKGHEELLDPKWIQDNSDTKRLQQKTAVAVQLLFSLVDRKLKGYMTPHRKDFGCAFLELKKVCGEDSLIVIGDQVLQLVHLTYQPRSSICEHSLTF